LVAVAASGQDGLPGTLRSQPAAGRKLACGLETWSKGIGAIVTMLEPDRVENRAGFNLCLRQTD